MELDRKKLLVLYVLVVSLFALAFFFEVYKFGSSLNELSDEYLPVVNQVNELKATIIESNKFLEDFMGASSIQERSELRDDFQDKVSQFLYGLSELRSLSYSEDLDRDVDAIEDAFLNYYNQSNQIILLTEENQSDFFLSNMEKSLEFEVFKIILLIDKINLNYSEFGYRIDELYSSFSIRVVIYMIFLICLSIGFLWLFRKRLLYKNSQLKAIIGRFRNIVSITSASQRENEFAVLISDYGIELGKSVSANDLTDPLLVDILDFLVSESAFRNVTFKDINKKFQITFPTTKKKISELEKLGLVTIMKSGRNKVIKLSKNL